jgi:hypothetical protein
MLQRMVDPYMDKVKGGWRKFNNERLHNFHSAKYR